MSTGARIHCREVFAASWIGRARSVSEGGSFPPPAHRVRRRGFTMIELLITAAVIALLSALVLAALVAVRARGTAARCSSNLHGLGLLMRQHLNQYDDKFWRYYRDEPGGRRWWFGFEPGGPGSGTGRPIDLNKGVLAEYAGDWAAERMLCPDFPYDAEGYSGKFVTPSASYGYNIHLGPASTSVPAVSYLAMRMPGDTVVFADGIHFDFGTGFNEGHYLKYQANTVIRDGYAHFRHAGQAQAVFADGHVEGRDILGTPHRTVGGGAAGNLQARDGSARVYDP